MSQTTKTFFSGDNPRHKTGEDVMKAKYKYVFENRVFCLLLSLASTWIILFRINGELFSKWLFWLIVIALIFRIWYSQYQYIALDKYTNKVIIKHFFNVEKIPINAISVIEIVYWKRAEGLPTCIIEYHQNGNTIRTKFGIWVLDKKLLQLILDYISEQNTKVRAVNLEKFFNYKYGIGKY